MTRNKKGDGMANFIVDNKTTKKLHQVLEQSIEEQSSVSLLLRAISLSGFEAF
jgi:hypothetical protein